MAKRQRKRKSGLIAELENVLPFLPELNGWQQQRVAEYIGRNVIAAEEERTMTKKQRLQKQIQEAEWNLASMNAKLKKLENDDSAWAEAEREMLQLYIETTGWSLERLRGFARGR